MKKSFYLLIICSICVAFHFSGCEKEVKVSGISVEPKELYLSKGDVAQLAYMVKPYGADNKSVTWKSEDISVATVSTTGLVTAIAEGKTQITATTNDGYFTDMVSVTVFHGSSEGDSIALVDLYKIATNLPYWDLSKPMEQWQGVVLNSNRRVEYITYGKIYINAPLSASIGDLTCLKLLSLEISYYHENDIIIPSEIGKLINLQSLYCYNGFTGTIPSELGNLIHLTNLTISDNFLTDGIPPELGNFTKIENLYLGNNQLIGDIPKELGNLTNLSSLSLYYNQLTGEIPQELENIRNLYYLDLRNNSLSGTIPQALLNRFGGEAFCPQNGTNFDNLDCSGY